EECDLARTGVLAHARDDDPPLTGERGSQHAPAGLVPAQRFLPVAGVESQRGVTACLHGSYREHRPRGGEGDTVEQRGSEAHHVREGAVWSVAEERVSRREPDVISRCGRYAPARRGAEGLRLAV